MKTLWALLCLSSVSLSAAAWTARPFAEVAVYPEFSAPAEAVAVDEAKIAAEVSGRIDSLPVRVGERVDRGAELARIDPAAYRVDLARVQAQVALLANRVHLAEAQLAQTEALAARGFVSRDGLRIKRTELAVLQSELAAARQSVEAARLQLSRTVIRAPYAGVVRERLASVGDLAVPGTALLVFAADERVEVHARVPAAQIESMRAAGAWYLVAGARQLPLTLLRVSPLLSAAGQAQVAVFAPRDRVPPGLAGALRWVSAQPYLPASWVLQRNGVLGVWRVRDGRPVFEALPQAEAGRPVPLALPPDALLVDEGRHALDLPADEVAR